MVDDMDRKDDDTSLFRQHVGETRPLGGREERVGPVRRARPHPPRPPQADRRTEAAGYALDPNADIERGSRLEFSRPGLQDREIRRLRRGQYPVQDQLVLRGLFAAEAERAMLDFIDRSHRNGLRCVCIVHGKGRSSAGGRPVLKGMVDRCLRDCAGVLAFCTAPDNAGGTGAVWVLLRARGAGARGGAQTRT